MAERNIIEKVKSYIYLLNSEGFNINRAYLYGSYATSQASEESDIDLMLISDDLNEPGIDKKSKAWILTRKIDSRIEPYLVTMKRFREDDTSPLLEIVRQQGVEISF